MTKGQTAMQRPIYPGVEAEQAICGLIALAYQCSMCPSH